MHGEEHWTIIHRLGRRPDSVGKNSRDPFSRVKTNGGTPGRRSYSGVRSGDGTFNPAQRDAWPLPKRLDHMFLDANRRTLTPRCRPRRTSRRELGEGRHVRPAHPPLEPLQADNEITGTAAAKTLRLQATANEARSVVVIERHPRRRRG